MKHLISPYIHVITQETNALMEDKVDELSPMQCKIIHSIHQYTDQLLIAAETVNETSYDDVERHKLLDLLTPIVGYVEMLADGWMGNFNASQQHERVNLIIAAVRRLADSVRSHPINDENIARLT
jgi:hypothetical protein